MKRVSVRLEPEMFKAVTDLRKFYGRLYSREDIIRVLVFGGMGDDLKKFYGVKDPLRNHKSIGKL